jgi:heme-degrading monooxygenase HmoA
MYARLVLFTTEPGARPTMEQIADSNVSLFKAQPGFVSVSFLVDEAETEYGTFTLWESKEAADAAFEALKPSLEKAAGVANAPPNIRLYEVYEPKG